ncbi:rhodanese-like domain-containing protein [Candidatus Chloroploca sp. Khr17]|uniref:rhodanese-like domain-containing protein n=1 Tax=Candidatus Chloroploca sp. Khr17 TaxID=2496869 RepID=UPI001F1061BE|nr:rhodanese-like domain-containing protein [Candidatus Chloroploca sp. Khr17]
MRRTMLLFFALLAAFGLAGCGTTTTPAAAPPPAAQVPQVAEISVQQLKTSLDAGDPIFLLDVRTPAEFAGDGHIPGSVLIPVEELASRMAEVPSDQPIACVCRSGNRSMTACNMLAANGFDVELYSMAGGMRAWIAAGFPYE